MLNFLTVAFGIFCFSLAALAGTEISDFFEKKSVYNEILLQKEKTESNIASIGALISAGGLSSQERDAARARLQAIDSRIADLQRKLSTRLSSAQLEQLQSQIAQLKKLKADVQAQLALHSDRLDRAEQRLAAAKNNAPVISVPQLSSQLNQACKSDLASLCQQFSDTEDRAMRCLRSNSRHISAPCKLVVRGYTVPQGASAPAGTGGSGGTNSTGGAR